MTYYTCGKLGKPGMLGKPGNKDDTSSVALGIAF